MAKTLMILGAGTGQLPAILKAKAKGYKVIATSSNSTDPGMAAADLPLTIDTRDVEQTLEAARHYKIDGILTLSTGVSLPALGKVVDEMGLTGPSFQAACFSADKISMKQRLLDWKIPAARSMVVKSVEEAKRAILELGLPAMLKVPDSSGSRGVIRIETLAELKQAFQTAKHYSNTHTFLLEEFMEGVEFGAQALVSRGRVRFIFLHNDTVTGFSCSVPIGHSYPSHFDEKLQAEAVGLIEHCVNALEINNSALNADLIMTSSGPKLIEIRASMGATCLPELTTLYSGLDWVDMAIEMAMGNEIVFNEKKEKSPCAGLLIRSGQTGTVMEMDCPRELLLDARTVALRWDKKRGDRVNKFNVGSDRIGEIVVKARTAEEAEEFCRKIEGKLTIKVRGNDESIETASI